MNPIADYLKLNKLTREAFARKLNLSTTFVINVVNGKNCNISITRLKAIHDVTNIPYEDLVEYFNGKVLQAKEKKEVS